MQAACGWAIRVAGTKGSVLSPSWRSCADLFGQGAGACGRGALEVCLCVASAAEACLLLPGAGSSFLRGWGVRQSPGCITKLELQLRFGSVMY